MKLTEDQERARDAILRFYGDPDGVGRLLTLGGFAGTGKSTVIAECMKELGPERGHVAFCALAGKAASVMKSKLEAAGSLLDGDYCGTIHGLIYETERVRREGVMDVKTAKGEEVAVRQPHTERTKQRIDWRRKEADSYPFTVVDEASMVNEQVFSDLEALGSPILAVGDHGQLPPIGGRFNLMKDPILRLERIHRQAEGDPIIRLSMMAREAGRIPVGEHGPRVRKIRADGGRGFADAIGRETMVLCGTNATRIFWNNFLRTRFGFASYDPEPGERVICLKNNHQEKIYNGMTGIVRSVEPSGKHWYWMEADMESGKRYAGRVFKHQFGSVSNCYDFTENGRAMLSQEIGDLFDWGWCITVHKAQGSEWDDVVVLEERFTRVEDDWRRWLYTAVTRSRGGLLVVGS